jgi:hypothetical protein
MPKRAICALVFVALGAATARAACTPWPNGIQGCLTLDKTASKCGQSAAGNVYKKLVPTIIKCQTKLVDDILAKGAASTYDEQGCEDAARQKFLDKTNTTACPCVSDTAIATATESALNGSSSLLLCDIGPAIATFSNPGASQITGTMPTSLDISKCQRKVGKCVATMVKQWIKCYQSYAKDYVTRNGVPQFDLDACVFGPIPGKPGRSVVEGWTSCTGKAGVGTTCQGCENIAGILAATQAQLQGNNDLAFCASPGAAFLDAR